MRTVKNDVLLACISKGRPQNVEYLQQQAGYIPINWYVPREEVEQYEDAGALIVVPVDGGLCEARNKALMDAFLTNQFCCQISDDYRKMVAVEVVDGKPKRRPSSLTEALERMFTQLDTPYWDRSYALVGVAPNDNLLNYRGEFRWSNFIVGDLIMVDPRCGLLFDTDLKLKEDYDYTLQHLVKYGMVCRIDALLAKFEHRVNSGGAVDFRTAEHEQEAISYLIRKWGDSIRLNPRRPNEVILKWKQPKSLQPA